MLMGNWSKEIFALFFLSYLLNFGFEFEHIELFIFVKVVDLEGFR